MGIFKNIGHAVASFVLGAFDVLTGRPTNGSAAEQVGGAAAKLLAIADPEAAALVNAAVTGFGDIVEAVKAAGSSIAAGATIEVKVSAALAAASAAIWPDVEKLLAAFEGAIGPQGPAPAAKPAA